MNIQDLIKLKEPLEPETITRFFPLLDSVERQQIQVIRILLYTRAAYEDMYVFENAVEVLNGIDPNIEIMEGSKPEYIWKVLDIIFRMYPKLELAWEVEAYIKYIFNDAGYYFYHPKLQLDNPIYNEVKKKAKEGPFPLEENYMGIQAIKYLKIQEYLKNS